MNTPDNALRCVTQQLLDRLVDGELSDLEHRELLARLDAERDGWRRCALAFLEAQSWVKSLGMVDRDADYHSVSRRTSPQAPGRPRSKRPVLSYAAWAAGILVSFTIGLATGGVWKTRGGSVDSESAKQFQNSVPAELAVLPESLVQATPARAATVSDSDRTVDMAQDSDSSAPAMHTVALLAWGARSERGGFAQQVPVFEGPGLDEQWLREQPPALPEYVQRQLERRGYEVEQRRELLTLNLAEGKRLKIPVDEVKLRYVGRRSVQ